MLGTLTATPPQLPGKKWLSQGAVLGTEKEASEMSPGAGVGRQKKKRMPRGAGVETRREEADKEGNED